jgi:hypothetical protein
MRARAVLQELIDLSIRLGPATLSCGINPCAFTLKVLNAFGVPEVRTEWAEQLDIPISRSWNAIAERLNDPNPSVKGVSTQEIRSAEELRRLSDLITDRVTPVPRGGPPRKPSSG